jgi:hypothetical protein
MDKLSDGKTGCDRLFIKFLPKIQSNLNQRYRTDKSNLNSPFRDKKSDDLESRFES